VLAEIEGKALRLANLTLEQKLNKLNTGLFETFVVLQQSHPRQYPKQAECPNTGNSQRLPPLKHFQKKSTDSRFFSLCRHCPS
jgi:hypothetical protein